eukprot:1161662-Pelagomonas_calceolata.AAC.4
MFHTVLSLSVTPQAPARHTSRACKCKERVQQDTPNARTETSKTHFEGMQMQEESPARHAQCKERETSKTHLKGMQMHGESLSLLKHQQDTPQGQVEHRGVGSHACHAHHQEVFQGVADDARGHQACCRCTCARGT